MFYTSGIGEARKKKKYYQDFYLWSRNRCHYQKCKIKEKKQVLRLGGGWKFNDFFWHVEFEVHAKYSQGDI